MRYSPAYIDALPEHHLTLFTIREIEAIIAHLDGDLTIPIQTSAYNGGIILLNIGKEILVLFYLRRDQHNQGFFADAMVATSFTNLLRTRYPGSDENLTSAMVLQLRIRQQKVTEQKLTDWICEKANMMHRENGQKRRKRQTGPKQLMRLPTYDTVVFD